VFGREKKCREELGGEQISKKKNVSSLFDGCLGLFIAPSAKFEAATLKPPLIRLILTLLDRYSFSVSKRVWKSKIQWSNQVMAPGS